MDLAGVGTACAEVVTDFADVVTDSADVAKGTHDWSANERVSILDGNRGTEAARAS